jgi:hypothetical protein
MIHLAGQLVLIAYGAGVIAALARRPRPRPARDDLYVVWRRRWESTGDPAALAAMLEQVRD